ncbi:MAG: hypothetical protein J07HX5_01557 [halophilic archaeon J07HX5]|nr:MAG: hypothetical protein J07HX5_01557 [halophilic archaeon J07HX5]
MEFRRGVSEMFLLFSLVHANGYPAALFPNPHYSGARSTHSLVGSSVGADLACSRPNRGDPLCLALAQMISAAGTALAIGVSLRAVTTIRLLAGTASRGPRQTQR